MQATNLAGPELHQYLTYLSEQAFVGAAVNEELAECERLLRAIAEDRLDSELLQAPGKHWDFRGCWACGTQGRPRARAHSAIAFPVKPGPMYALQRLPFLWPDLHFPQASAKAPELRGLQSPGQAVAPQKVLVGIGHGGLGVLPDRNHTWHTPAWS